MSYQPYPERPSGGTSALAIASLVSGIAAWTVLPFIGGIAAVICGHMARGEIRRAAGTMEGDGLAIAGLVLGYAQLALITLVVVAIIVAIALGLSLSSWH